jgi:AcrR family transcriptional regulator
MGSSTARPTRREQRREQTVREIQALAMQQVAADGPEAVSLNAIARTMAMSPAAIYRYFDSRDALLADLVVAYYDALADTLEAAAKEWSEPGERLVALARAYRRWALDNPNPYRLIFHTSSGSGHLAPERTIPASVRSMDAILAALAGNSSAAGSGGVGSGGVGSGGVEPDSVEPDSVDGRLDAQLRKWAAERSQLPDLPTRLLALGLTCWTRLHGIVSLELGHHLASTGVDPALLYEAEVHVLIRQASAANC